MSALRILLLSDLHAFAASNDELGKVDSYPSYLEIGNISTEPHLNPFAGLKQLISVQSIRADLVVCAGDMGDKANPNGISYVWENLQQLGSGLID